MKKLDFGKIGVTEMNESEMQKIGGGWVWAFIAGAIIGGMVYDAYKAMCKTILNGQIEHPDYYDGPVHSHM